MATAGLYLVPIFNAAACHTTPMQRETRVLRLGIAGLGQAAAAMLPEILGDARVQLVAAADVRPEARAQFERELEGRAYAEVQQLCADPDVDVVYVATPHQFHAAHAIQAAEHGKHVLLEKPMALTLVDCDAMIEAADKHGVRLLVGRGSHGFDPPILKIREIVRSGELGSLGMIHTWHYGDFLYRPRTPAELDTSQGGGVIFNQGPHQIDIVRIIGGGMLRSVRAMTGNWDSARSTEGAFSCYLEFEDGAGATRCLQRLRSISIPTSTTTGSGRMARENARTTMAERAGSSMH